MASEGEKTKKPTPHDPEGRRAITPGTLLERRARGYFVQPWLRKRGTPLMGCSFPKWAPARGRLFGSTEDIPRHGRGSWWTNTNFGSTAIARTKINHKTRRTPGQLAAIHTSQSGLPSEYLLASIVRSGCVACRRGSEVLEGIGSAGPKWYICPVPAISYPLGDKPKL